VGVPQKTTIRERFRDVLAGKPGRPLAAIWNTAPFLNALAKVDLKTYYHDSQTKLEVQLEFQEAFPDVLCLPGIWADFGALAEPSAFGCRIDWPDRGMPMAQPVFRTRQEILRARPPDPSRDGLLPEALADYRCFWDNLDERYMGEYGYLEGVAASFGPMELAAVLMGHASFFKHLIFDPGLIQGLLKITTEFVISWLEAQEEVNGPLKRIALADHLPGQISPDHFQEFWRPSFKQVVIHWPEAIILYHNEYPVPYAQALAGLGIDIFHFGGPVGPLKTALGGEMTLMGNLDPVGLLLSSTPEEVFEEAGRVLEKGQVGGRFLLSSGGGLAPETPFENVAAMVKAAEEWSQSNSH
jgi:uroporphyrinogen-III decarboxylase